MNIRPYLKLAVCLLVLVNLWQFWHVPAIDEAILQFIAAGVVPGTNIMLSPNAMMWLLGGVMALSFVLIFYKELRQGVRALAGGSRVRQQRRMLTRLQYVDIPSTAMATAALPEPLAVQHAVITAPAPVKKRSAKKAKVRRLRRTSLRRLVLTRLQAAVYGALAFLQRLRQVLRPYWYRLLAGVFLVFALASIAAAGLAAFTWEGIKQLWRRAEPSCRQFDQWLERKLKRNDLFVALLSASSQFVKVAAIWWAEARALLTRTTKNS